MHNTQGEKERTLSLFSIFNSQYSVRSIFRRLENMLCFTTPSPLHTQQFQLISQINNDSITNIYVCFCNMLFQTKCMWAYIYVVHIIPNMIKRIKVQAKTKISFLPCSGFPSNSIPNNNNIVDIVKGKSNDKKWRMNERTEPNSVNIDIISSKMMLFFFFR